MAHTQRGSATIYDFARHARAAEAARGRGPVPAARPARPQAPASGGWYHESALQEADPSRKS